MYNEEHFEIIYLRSIKGRYSIFLSNDAGERILILFNGLLSKESVLPRVKPKD